jgi:APA family basic amino acid/polyamine antiporter
MNSAMMAGSRTFYSIALRNMGPKPDVVKVVDKKTDMPPTSAAISLIFCGFMMLVVFFNAQDLPYHTRWFSYIFGEGISVMVTSLTPITLMAFYIPIFIYVMLKEKEWNFVNRFVMPLLSISGAILLIYMVFDTNWRGAVIYLVGFAIIMGIGGLFLAFNKKSE